MSNSTFDYDAARTRVLNAMFKPTFSFMIKSLSAWDAADLVHSNPNIEYQLGKVMDHRDGHEVELHQEALEPGDPVSPVIVSVEESLSAMYVTFRFRDAAMYMTIPAMSTIELGWLRKNV